MISRLLVAATILLLSSNFFQLAESVCTSNVACFPNPEDVVSKISDGSVVFNVTSVCGNPPEAYCSPSTCGLLCNASDSSNRHPKEYMTDVYSLPTYWKSKNLESPVIIQVDLNMKLILHQITVSFQYEYPSHVQIERSQDYGRSYYIIHHNAINCVTSSGLVASSNYQATVPVCMTIVISHSSKAVCVVF